MKKAVQEADWAGSHWLLVSVLFELVTWHL